MSAVATEKWSGKFRGSTVTGGVPDETATRLWDVIGATSVDNAKTASGVAAINDSYNGDSSKLKCRDVGGRQIAPGVYEVIAQYSIPPNGSWTTVTDPLTDPPTIRWSSVVVEVPFDIDINGNPLINANNDQLDPAPTKTIIKRTLQITRNFAFYDMATWATYENTVNSDSLTFTEPNGRTVTFASQMMKCCTIEPAAAYNKNASYVPMCATFDIFIPNDKTIATDKPHQLRTPHVGSNGYYDDSGTKRNGVFATSRGEVRSNVLLYQNGTPRDETLIVKDYDKGGTPVSLGSAPTGATFETYGDIATFIKYDRYKAVAFAALFAAFGA